MTKPDFIVFLISLQFAEIDVAAPSGPSTQFCLSDQYDDTSNHLNAPDRSFFHVAMPQ
jgi:hypothetical protein